MTKRFVAAGGWAVVGLLLVLFTSSLVSAQVPSSTATDLPSGAPASAPTPTALGLVGEPLLERTIDGSGYTLGPGDVLGLSLQGTISKATDLVVSPEGTVLIPGAGEVHLAGRSLDEARRVIRAEVARAFRNVQVSVTLLRLRRFTIFVLGQVRNPGQYTASPVDRVSEGVRLAGGLLDPRDVSQRTTLAERSSERSVHLIHQDGSVERADLLRFRRTGELSANPSVRDGDVILVDFRQDGVLLHGEVHSPGEFEFVSGDTLGGVIELAGGLTQRAMLDTVEVARYRSGSAVPELLRLSGRSANDRAALFAFRLEARDAILIRTDPDWDIRHTVNVTGEVAYPGVYAIEEDRTTLSELIERAGGFTRDASLREAKLVRRVDETIKDAEYERLRTVSPADMSHDEYEYFKMRSRQRLGLMAVDFEALFERNDHTQDATLRDDDQVQVPPKKAYVTLAGQVALPGNIAYEPGLTLDEYVTRGGGYAWKGAKGKTVVIRASTGEWIPKNEAHRIEPGDTIWVPERPEREWYALFKDSLTLTAQLATIFLVIRSSTQ